MKILRKVFGGLNLSWLTVIVAAVATGAYTAVMAMLPLVQDTSFQTIAVSFEAWILFGIIIIMNAKSNLDSALKCFVFFLISQPLVYFLQILLGGQGWGLFRYYKIWFIWTLLCLPMGYIGYFIKKDKWWGYLILLPMIGLTALSYYDYLSSFTFCRPHYILTSIFCAAAMILYPIALFRNKKIQTTGAVISILLFVGITVYVAMHPHIYSTAILGSVDGKDISADYQVSLADEQYGDVYIEYDDSFEAYVVHADFKKKGTTELILQTPEGKIRKYDLVINASGYELNEN